MGHYAEVTQEMVENVATSILELDMEDDANQEAYQTLLGYRDGIRAGEIDVDAEAKNMVDRAIAQVEKEMGITGGKSSQFSKLGELTATGYMIGVSGSTADVNDTMSSVATGALHAFENTMEVASPSKATERDGEYTVQGFINGVNNKSGESTSALTQCAQDALNGFKGVATSTALQSAGSSTIQGFINGADSKSGTMTSKMQSLASSAKSSFTNNATTSTLYSSGQNTIQGYINGIDNKSSTLYKKMTSVASTAISKFNNTLQIASPSKVMTQSGEYTDEGFIIGIENGESEVGRAMDHLANTATSSFDESMDPLSVSTNMDYSATMSGAVNQSLFGISQQIMAMADEIASRPVVVQINGKNFATATSGDMDSAMGTRQQLVARGLSL